MVRGTGFRIGVEANSGLTRSEVTEGAVAVEAEGERVEVAAGYGTLVEAGKSPTSPRRLLDRPDLTHLPTEADIGSLSLRWPALEGAGGYRLKLQAADDADSVWQDVVLESPGHQLQNLQPGRYLLLVRGIDELGLEGLTARSPLQVNQASLPPPVLPEPPAQREAPTLETPHFGPGWIDFRWSQVSDAWSYRLSLARDLSFETPLFERIATATSLRLPIHWRGRLYVRVDALFQTEPAETHSQVFRIELPGR
jgi:hypothetical protein